MFVILSVFHNIFFFSLKNFVFSSCFSIRRIMLKQSMLPRIAQDTKIMIIGSMPGEVSLQRQQYYAYPQNNFWKFMSVLFSDVNLKEDYEQRVANLLKNHIGLWDALKCCERVGSMDSAIRHAEPNDFSFLSSQAPSLCRLVFNGKKAYQSFIKSPNLDWAQKKSIHLVCVPSTSPANASISYEEKLRLWAKALKIS